MEESTDISQTPKPNEFVIAEKTAYAMTDVETWEVAKYLTGLETLKLEDLDPDDRFCPICQEELLVSDDVSPSHDPVKIVCGHIFGRKCINRWFDPLCSWAFLQSHQAANRDHAPLLGNSGCPMCRRVCFSEVLVEPLELLTSRLRFWDLAYESAGVARSEREERSRENLRQYIVYRHSINDDEPEEPWDVELLLKHAQTLLLGFATCLKIQTLTPEQENLRKKLERIARKELEIRVEDDSYLVNIDSEDDEGAESANDSLDEPLEAEPLETEPLETEPSETDIETEWEPDSEEDSSD